MNDLIEMTQPYFNSIENRPNRDQILEIRRFMILYMKQLVISSPGTQEEELRAILNYLHTTQEVMSKETSTNKYVYYVYFLP